MSENFWGSLILYATAGLVWLGGEAGRAYVAGATGGLVRWWLIGRGRRRVVDGITAAIGGAVFAAYFAPVTLALLEKLLGQLGDGAQDAATFTTGMLGMSTAKIAIAAFESRVKHWGDGGGDDNG